MGNSLSGDENKDISEGFKHSPNEIRQYKSDLEYMRRSYHAGNMDKAIMERVLKNSAKMEQFFEDADNFVHHKTTQPKTPATRPAHVKPPDEVQYHMQILTAQCQSLESELTRVKRQEQNYLEQIRKLGNSTAKLTKERDDLFTRLSREMDEKIAKDESNFENINIKNRPMKIAEDYENLCAHSWLAAKEVIDKHIPIEEERVKFLRDIMMEEVKIAQEKHQEITMEIFKMVYIQAEYGTARDVGKRKAIQTAVIVDKIPDGLKIAIWDFLRVTADTADVSDISQNISSDLQDRMKSGKTARSLCLSVKEIPQHNMSAQLNFMNDFARLAWKMATQRPQMSFDDQKGIGQNWLGEKLQDVGFRSENPQDPQNVVKYYELPALLHGGKLMKKGRVFIGRKD